MAKQALRLQRGVTSNADGTVTFDFGYVPAGLIWQGTFNVVGCGSSAVWTVMVGGIGWLLSHLKGGK